jgi:plasmid maintenance system killer protein
MMEDIVIHRISDLRVSQAQKHGRIVGLSREDARQIALKADLLTVVYSWSDLHFMFADLEQHSNGIWKIAIDRRWSLLFEWVEGFGPVNIRLDE